jgi:hypothetical protein
MIMTGLSQPLTGQQVKNAGTEKRAAQTDVQDVSHWLIAPQHDYASLSIPGGI